MYSCAYRRNVLLRTTSNWTSRISYEDVASLLSKLSVCVVQMRFYSFNYIGAQNNLSLSTQLSLRISSTNEQWTYILLPPPIKLYQATLEAARDHMVSMTKNARRLNDGLLNSSNGLLRSASSPGIASTMLMRFYPIIPRCNEPLEAAHAHIDGMSCCGPPPIGPLGSATKMYHRCWARYISA